MSGMNIGGFIRMLQEDLVILCLKDVAGDTIIMEEKWKYIKYDNNI